jgi:ribokinase
MSDSPDLVLLGNLLVDDIVLRDGSTLMGEPGGAILHAALGAQLWGARVGLVSVVGNDYPRSAMEALEKRGIDLAGVRRLDGPGGRAWLLYEADVRRFVHHLNCPTHDLISPSFEDIPHAYAMAKAFHLAPMPIARQRQLAESLATKSLYGSPPTTAFVSLDPCELVRDDNFADWLAILALVDAFFPSEDEWRVSGDAATMLRGAASGRLRFAAIKQSVRGGQLLDRHRGETITWKAKSHKTVDATGAGDAFVGGFLAGWLASGDAKRAIEQGVVAASFAIEDWGARGLLAATPEQARSRWQSWFSTPVTA